MNRQTGTVASAKRLRSLSHISQTCVSHFHRGRRNVWYDTAEEDTRLYAYDIQSWERFPAPTTADQTKQNPISPAHTPIPINNMVKSNDSVAWCAFKAEGTPCVAAGSNIGCYFGCCSP